MGNRVSLGALSRSVKESAHWNDSYPSSQAFADEFEQLLEFARSRGVFEEYLPRLRGRERQRDAALAELRVARYLSQKGYEPLRHTWQINGGPDSVGEFVIQGTSGSRVMVEVKRRDWQSELRPDETRARRAEQDRYRDVEARAVDLEGYIRGAIDNAYKKFNGEIPTLLVVDGDGLLLPPLPHFDYSSCQFDGQVISPQAHLGPPPALYASGTASHPAGCFTDSRFENLGGVGIFRLVKNSYQTVCRGMDLYVNGFVLSIARLPHDFVNAFNGRRLWLDPSDPSRQGTWLSPQNGLSRDKILSILRAEQNRLSQFGVKSLLLFGSAARGENDPSSDLDFIVELNPKTFANYMGLKEYLEKLFTCRVDLVLADSLRPSLRDRILAECVHAA
jgi:predicted nucleotidyltransferase